MASWSGRHNGFHWCYQYDKYEDDDRIVYMNSIKNALQEAPYTPTGLCTISYKLTPPSPKQRREIADFLAKPENIHGSNCLRAHAALTDSVIIRGIVTAMTWIVEPCYPNKSFGDYKKAISWIGEQIGEELDSDAIWFDILSKVSPFAHWRWW